MALFDLPTAIGYRDYPIMSMLSKTTQLPKPLVAGETDYNQTLNQIAGFVGAAYSIYLNKLI